jgi:hypothetical protein
MGSFCGNYRSGTNNWASFINGESYVLIFEKNGLGYSLGDFFINASGHPVYQSQNHRVEE